MVVKLKAKERSLCNGYVRNHTNNETTYEHRDVAEEIIGRKLRSEEDVHHLDGNRSNNSPENLLVLETTQHAKLHSWLDKNIVVPKPSYALRKMKGCVRCDCCDKPINDGEKYCSQECFRTCFIKPGKLSDINKEELEVLIKEKTYTELGKIFGVSDNGIRKKCKSLGIILPVKRKLLLT